MRSQISKGRLYFLLAFIGLYWIPLRKLFWTKLKTQIPGVADEIFIWRFIFKRAFHFNVLVNFADVNICRHWCSRGLFLAYIFYCGNFHQQGTVVFWFSSKTWRRYGCIIALALNFYYFYQCWLSSIFVFPNLFTPPPWLQFHESNSPYWIKLKLWMYESTLASISGLLSVISIMMMHSSLLFVVYVIRLPLGLLKNSFDLIWCTLLEGCTPLP